MSQAHADAQWDIQPERRLCERSHFFQGDCGVFLQSQQQLQQQLGNIIDPTATRHQLTSLKVARPAWRCLCCCLCELMRSAELNWSQMKGKKKCTSYSAGLAFMFFFAK